MKGLWAKDLRGNDPEELMRTLAKLQGDLFQHRLKKTTNQLENVMVLRNTRRDIAKVLTVLGERQRHGAPAIVPSSAPAAAKPAVETAPPVASAPAAQAAPKSAVVVKTAAKGSKKPSTSTKASPVEAATKKQKKKEK